MRRCNEAAELLCRLLDAVEAGEEASSAQGARMRRRIEGAVLTLDAIATPD
jgi:hypothetical protein